MIQLRLFLIETRITALQWLRCRMAGWLGSAYTQRDQLAAQLAWRKPL